MVRRRFFGRIYGSMKLCLIPILEPNPTPLLKMHQFVTFCSPLISEMPSIYLSVQAHEQVRQLQSETADTNIAGLTRDRWTCVCPRRRGGMEFKENVYCDFLLQGYSGPRKFQLATEIKMHSKDQSVRMVPTI